MRQSIHELLSALTPLLPCSGRIVELGSLQHQPERVSDLRPHFQGCESYVGIDQAEGPGVDRVGNLHQLDDEDESADVVLCVDTLEHVRNPHRAMFQLGRILADGGWALVVTVFWWPLHTEHDLFRFTPQGLAAVLNHRNLESVVFAAGDTDGPHTVLALCWKGATQPAGMEEAKHAAAEWCKEHRWTP